MQQIETKPEYINIQSVFDYYSSINNGPVARFGSHAHERQIEDRTYEDEFVIETETDNPNKEDEE